MERKIVYLINPISGTAKKEGLKELIAKETEAQKIHYEILPTNAAGNYLFLKEKIAEENISDIVMVGGDGTVNQVVATLRNEKVRFGIIPVGSGNGLARAANIPMKSKDALQFFFYWRSQKNRCLLHQQPFLLHA